MHGWVVNMQPKITRREYDWGCEVRVRLRRPGKRDLETTLDCHGKVTATPSYAVNPPYINYVGQPEWTWGPSRVQVVDRRQERWAAELQCAWTAHGTYATDEELQAVLDALPEALAVLEPERVLAALGA
jgi:hypothetical protein